MPDALWGAVTLTVAVETATEAHFSHGNHENGQYCLTFYPELVCTCGHVGLVWVVVKDDGAQPGEAS